MQIGPMEYVWKLNFGCKCLYEEDGLNVVVSFFGWYFDLVLFSFCQFAFYPPYLLGSMKNKLLIWIFFALGCLEGDTEIRSGYFDQRKGTDSRNLYRGPIQPSRQLAGRVFWKCDAPLVSLRYNFNERCIMN